MNSTESLDHFQTALQPLLLQALNQMADGVMLTDRDGRIAWVNQAFCRLRSSTTPPSRSACSSANTFSPGMTR